MIQLTFFVMLITQPIYELDEIVVTATRYPVALQNIAVATMVIDRPYIESIRALNIGELLHGSAGVDIKDYGTPGVVMSVTLRGIPSNGTLVLLNGQPLNMMTTGMADLSVVDISAVERIEIVKGPVSSIYGANTLGGVVNIITTKERNKPEIRANASSFTTTFDTLLQNKYLSIVAVVPRSRLQVDVSAVYQNSLGLRSNSDLTKYNLQGTVAYRADALTVQAHMLYDDKDYGLPGPMPLIDSLHPVPVFGDSTATSVFDRENDATLLGNAEVHWTISEQILWEHRLYGDRREGSFHTQYAGWMSDTIIEDHGYLTYSGGYNTMLLTKFSNLDMAIGLDVRLDSLRTEKVSAQSGDTIWNASSYTFGGWCRAKRDFGEIVSLTPSLRIDYNRDFGTFYSPSIGLISALQSNLVFKASIGRTFRAPSLNDLYWPVSGNRELTPEYGWAYEVRIEASPIPLMFGAVSLFTRDIKDRISWMPDTGSLWKPQNLNELSIIGMDIELRGQVFGIMDVSAEGTYLSATQKNDEIVYDYYDWVADTGLTIIQEIEREAAFIPQYTLNFSQHIHAPYAIDIDLCELYVAPRRNYYVNYDDHPVVTMNEKTLNRYILFNVSVTKAFTRFITLTIGVKNVLNVKYATQFGYSVSDLDYPMPARTFLAQLGVKY